MPNDLLNSTICLESLICVAQVPMMEQIMRSLLFLVPGEVIQFWAMAFELACLSEKRDRVPPRAERRRGQLSHCFSGSYWRSGYGNKGRDAWQHGN